jgi:predicted metal-dependent hydrolase
MPAFPNRYHVPATCGIEYSMSRENVDKVRKSAELRKQGGPAATGQLDPWSCDEIPPDLLYQGLEQFNRGEYFEQHESLEEIWIADQRPLRRLYQGILKIGVGFYKLRLGNHRGTVNHIAGGIAYLERFDGDCLGVDIARLIREAAEVRERVVELGPERIGEFDLKTLPSVHYTRRAGQTSVQVETSGR